MKIEHMRNPSNIARSLCGILVEDEVIKGYFLLGQFKSSANYCKKCMTSAELFDPKNEIAHLSVVCHDQEHRVVKDSTGKKVTVLCRLCKMKIGQLKDWGK